MIIKNNFNDKSADPLNDYHEIGKGRNSLNHEMEMEQEGFIKENMDNPIIQDIINNDHEYEDDDDNNDKWDFFR